MKIHKRNGLNVIFGRNVGNLHLQEYTGSHTAEDHNIFTSVKTSNFI
jgi:hypothetical protein